MAAWGAALRRVSVCGFGALAGLAVAMAARAQPVESFYRGQNLRILVI